MKRFFLSLFLIFASSSMAPAAGAFIDCGRGYIVAAAKSREGIPTQECKKLFCRDLENGRVMGADGGMNPGYENKGMVVQEDNDGNRIDCFGQRRWCSSGQAGQFNPEYGIYTKGGGDADAYRGILKGNCFEWQATNYSCGPGEVAVIDKDTSSWVCLTAGSGAGGRSAVKARAVRRTSVITPFKK